MQDIFLFDPVTTRRRLLPLTFTRPVADLRCGMLTIREKWEMAMPGRYNMLAAEPEIQAVWPLPDDITDDSLYIAGNIAPDDQLVATLKALPEGAALIDREGKLIAYRGDKFDLHTDFAVRIGYPGTIKRITSVTDIFTLNGEWLKEDFALITAGRTSANPDSSAVVIGPRENLFIEEGASVLGCTLNTLEGPIYIGKDASVMEGSNLRGPIAVMEGSTVKMGTRIYGDTTIGPHSKVGGEISNIVIHSYSNKAHDGYLGNAVLGAWCNLGADTVASNLKNDYGNVRVYSYVTERFEPTGLQFCGLIMGDHSHCGINTMFNTATVVGIGCNIFGDGFPRTFIPSFSYGGAAGMKKIRLDNFLNGAERMMARRNQPLTPQLKTLYTKLYSD